MNSILSWVMVLGCLAALFHFLFEAIIAPAWRQGIRFRLFRLRDELRLLHRTDSRVDNRAFEALDSMLSRQIKYQHQISLSLLMGLQRDESDDPESRKEIDADMNAMRGCESGDYRRIHGGAISCFMDVIACNGLVWYIIPLSPVFAIKSCFGSVRAKLERIIAAPDRQFLKRTSEQPA